MTTHLPTPILHVLLTLSLLTNLSLAPIQPEWSPDPDDVMMVSQTVWGEYRGEDADQRAAVVWCILNRVEDDRFPNAISEVVRQPHQFQGYSPNNPAEPFADEVRDILIRWHEGEHGIDPSLCWFYGDGRINHYRNAWKAEEASVVWP